MSSYFDQLNNRVVGEDVDGVIHVEQEMIREVLLVTGDREFPEDLRQKAVALIGTWAVESKLEEFVPGIGPSPGVKHFKVMGYSRLIHEMHSLFHEVASREIKTRFGRFGDRPNLTLKQRDNWIKETFED